MELSLSLHLPILLLLSLFWYIYKLPYYYHIARKTGLPVYICPVTPSNPVWLIVLATCQPLLVCYLPQFVYTRLRPCIYGWEYRERYDMQTELGPSFVLVTPNGNEVWTADPDAAADILARRKDFSHLEITERMLMPFIAGLKHILIRLGIMSIFGHNLTSVSAHIAQNKCVLVVDDH